MPLWKIYHPVGAFAAEDKSRADLRPPPGSRARSLLPLQEMKMHYQVDLDPKHSVIRLTVMAETVTQEMAEEFYQYLLAVTMTGGPYAAVYDLSAVKHTTVPTDMVMDIALRRQSVPKGRKQVVVCKEPHIYGLARLFQTCAEFPGKEFDIVHTLEEAYDKVGVRPEDFTECMLSPRV